MMLLRRFATWLGRVSPRAYAYPAIDISLPQNRHLHLVGSIHMGSVEMAPLPSALQQQLQQATALVVEADITDAGSLLEEEYVEQPLSARLGPSRYVEFQQLCATLGLNASRFPHLPAWHIALQLQAVQAQSLGLRPDYGIDYQLIQAARAQHLPIMELEGQQQQLNLLRQLPNGGIALLEDTLDHWHVNARLLQVMMGWWLASPPQRSLPEMPATFSQPLSEVLMHRRNAHWQQQLQALPPGRYVIAVGALHLYGDGNLPALLRTTASRQTERF